MKRALIALAFAVAVPATVRAQTHVRVSVEFTGESHAKSLSDADLGQAMALRGASRAWQDSVDVMLDVMFEQAASQGWVRAKGGQFDYRVAVMALPVLIDQKPTGLVTYSVILFKPGFTAQKYITSFVGYSGNARAAAQAILDFAVPSINTDRAG